MTYQPTPDLTGVLYLYTFLTGSILFLIGGGACCLQRHLTLPAT